MCPGCLRDRWRLARSEVFLHPCTLGLERAFWGAPLGGVGAVGGAGWWDPQRRLECIGLTVVGGEATFLDSSSLLFACWCCEVACPALESL